MLLIINDFSSKYIQPSLILSKFTISHLHGQIKRQNQQFKLGNILFEAHRLYANLVHHMKPSSTVGTTVNAVKVELFQDLLIMKSYQNQKLFFNSIHYFLSVLLLKMENIFGEILTIVI